jgi:hypothetical protein
MQVGSLHWRGVPKLSEETYNDLKSKYLILEGDRCNQVGCESCYMINPKTGVKIISKDQCQSHFQTNCCY